MAENNKGEHRPMEELSDLSAARGNYANLPDEEDPTEQPQKPKIYVFGKCCSGRELSIICEIILIGVGLLLIAQLFFVPTMVENAFYTTLQSKYVMTADQQQQNTQAYQQWVTNNNSDGAIQLFEYWLFNITNPLEVTQGSIPKLKPIGPFVFRRYEHKENIVFNNDSSQVSYSYHYSFEFQQNLSSTNYSLYDPIVILNPALLTFFQFVNYVYTLVNSTLYDAWLKSLPATHMYYYTTPYRALTGIWDPSLDAEIRQPNKSSIFAYINAGSCNVQEYTGSGNYSMLRLLVKFFNVTQMNFWATPESIYGSRETRIFPYSTVNKQASLLAYSTDKYRKTNFSYYQTVKFNGLSLYRFRVTNQTFWNATNFAPNAQFYQFGHDGLINLTNRKASPKQTVTFVSKSYFLDAEYYQQNVSIPYGLREPIFETDDQYFDIDPKSGVVFRMNLGIMLSFGLFPLKAPYKNNFTNFSNIIVPWGNQIIYGYPPDSTLDNYVSQLNSIESITNASLYGGPTFAVVCFGITFFLICRRRQLDAFKAPVENLIDDNEKNSNNDATEDGENNDNITGNNSENKNNNISYGSVSNLLDSDNNRFTDNENNTNDKN